MAALLAAGSLDRYYAFQGGPTAPVTLAVRARDLAWLEGPLVAAEAGAAGELVRLQFDLQGVRCSGCVWLIRELFRRHPGGVEALVEPGVGRVTLTFRRGACDVAAFVRELGRFGYGAGPALKDDADASDATLTRLGICAALTMNAMVFSVAHYMGMTAADGLAFTVLRWLELGLGAAVVLIGGREFFERTVRGLRAGLLPFELPIALGIGLAFCGSTVLWVRDPTTFSFFDTVDAFTTLMLVGRWLQERVLVQNRRGLLADAGIAGLFARRVRADRVETVSAAEVEAGDRLLVPPGDLLVAAARPISGSTAFSLDWINGESVPRSFASDAVVPAGAFNAGGSAALLEVDQPFNGSALVSLLSAPAAAGDSGATSDYGSLLEAIGRAYVPAVLTLASTTFLYWLSRDPALAIRAATSVLVVTCPCALGLAIPLAYQLTAAQLRQRGLFVCRASFLDRAARVKRVAFDKTGTLTLGTLRLTNPHQLDALGPADLSAAYNLASRSSHPRSQCLLAALESRVARFDTAAEVAEVAGKGLQLRTAEGVIYRLGKPSWIGGVAGAGEDDLGLARDGEVIAQFAMEEHLRSDARSEVQNLLANGREVVVLSGDRTARVQRVAAALGLPQASAVGDLSPEGKADWLTARGAERDTLLVGDGLNDRLALDCALCGGTPAVDHPTLSSRADFYFLTSGLQCLRVALDAAQRLRTTTRAVLALALIYNVGALAGAVSGHVGPLAAAVSMPASSILILLFTARATRLAADQARAPVLHGAASSPLESAA